METEADFVVKCLESFQEVTNKPTHFLETKESLSDQIRTNLKQTYDFSKSQELNTLKSSALPQLIVKNFDLEQIWQQIELQNNSLLTRSLTTVSKLIVSKNTLVFKNLESTIEDKLDDEREKSTDDEREEDRDDEREEVKGDEREQPDDADSAKTSESEPDLSDVELDENDDSAPAATRKKPKPSIVDDEFFKLEEMERFLNSEEKKLEEPDSGNDSESESDADLLEDEDVTDDDDKMAKYRDFFEAQEPQPKKSRHKSLEDEDVEAKSTFEKRQERLGKKIEELEEEAVAEKAWQLRGEITADSRPINSLLEEVVDFDMTTRPPPVMTEQTTMQLEDIIKQRIKDRAFDSVERKAKPVETPLEYKKKLVLDQEKSKESLAQIYEKEFLDAQAALDPDREDKEEVPELHKEIDSLMGKLFVKLDALSNFHFTPKPSRPELRIVSNLPAINMEEVAPVAMSDANLLAPEEVKRKGKGDVVGEKERSATDKKRERRKKKLKQKIHAKNKDKMKKVGLGNKYSKEKVKHVLEKVVKDKNVDTMNDAGKTVKSSKAFFSQLEDEVKSQIKRKVTEQKKKKKYDVTAKKLKL